MNVAKKTGRRQSPEPERFLPKSAFVTLVGMADTVSMARLELTMSVQHKKPKTPIQAEIIKNSIRYLRMIEKDLRISAEPAIALKVGAIASELEISSMPRNQE
jgi:hypothetical protein